VCDVVLEGVFRRFDPTGLVRRFGAVQVQLALDVVNFKVQHEDRVTSPTGLLVAMLSRNLVLVPQGFVHREKRGLPASAPSDSPSATSPLSPPRCPYTAEELRKRQAEAREAAEREATRARVELRRSRLSPAELEALEARARTNVQASHEVAWRQRLNIAAPPMSPELMEIAVRAAMNRLLAEGPGTGPELPS
jgi:hypothetical protein